MRRLFLFVVLPAAACAAAFGVARSVAAPEPPSVRHDLPVGAIKSEPLAPKERVVATKVLGAELAERAGITESSFDRARGLGQTSRGRLYFIPGRSGACLLLADGITCGDPGSAGGPLLALLRIDPSGSAMVGGGVTVRGVETVTITHPSSGAVVIPVTKGVFRVTEAHGLQPSREGLSFAVD